MGLMFSRAWLFRLLINIWPPLFFSRIKLESISEDFRQARAVMRLSAFNRNGVGSLFGGALFSLTDPFYMMMLMARLGKDYTIWDKYADIDFIKPGRGKVYADFILTDELLKEIEVQTANGGKYLPTLTVYIKDEQDEVVAKVMRTLYIRKKKK